MTSWSFIEAASQLLPPNDRDAVLGDLAETNESPRQMLAQLLGLAARRHVALWTSWQPWMAAFGLALPTSFLLMGASVSVSSMFQRMDWQMLSAHDAALNLSSIVFLLICWSWSAGFVVSSISRRTLWVSGVSCFIPCLFCLARFHRESLPGFSLFLFLLPALLGIWHGIRTTRISLSFALIMAVAVTTLMILTSSRVFWRCDLALLWPTWYLVAVSSGKAAKAEEGMTA
jgi:hypothetical protein